MRLLLLSEDYGGSLLTMTDCDNNELKQILERAEENDENDIGQTLTEICKELFSDKFMLEIGCSEESAYSGITELETETIVSTNYLTFSIVRNEKDEV